MPASCLMALCATVGPSWTPYQPRDARRAVAAPAYPAKGGDARWRGSGSPRGPRAGRRTHGHCRQHARYAARPGGPQLGLQAPRAATLCPRRRCPWPEGDARWRGSGSPRGPRAGRRTQGHCGQHARCAARPGGPQLGLQAPRAAALWRRRRALKRQLPRAA